VAAADTLAEADDDDELDFLLWYITQVTINFSTHLFVESQHWKFSPPFTHERKPNSEKMGIQDFKHIFWYRKKEINLLRLSKLRK
jgi:hypothetical protein